MSGCQMVCISNGCLKNGQTMSVLWSKMSGIQMVRLIKPLENWTKKVPEKSNVRISGVRYSDGYCKSFTRSDSELKQVHS